VGLNPKVLDSLDAEITSGRYGYVDRMLVIRRGRVAFDKAYTHDYARIYADSARVTGALNPHDETGPYNYYNPWWHPYYRKEGLHTLQSVTKTITSVVIGAAVARNEFPSIDTPVLSFFDVAKVANVDERKRRMTISGASELLAYIFRKATKTDIEEYAARHLFAPLGIPRWYWKRTPHGLVDTEGGLYLEARDLAKIWYLFLRNGSWDGRQVVTADWVKSSVAPAVAVAPAPNAARYGLKWWLYPDPRGADRYIWGGSGFGGQIPMAFPGDDMIVVFNAWNILPGRPSLPRAQVTARLVNAIVAP
jgi:CubicO group peptidase (beta-lactamase class C family)